MASEQTPITAQERRTQTGVAEAVTEWVRDILDPIPVNFGELDQSATSAEVKVAPADPVVKRYSSGGGIYTFSYEVYLRVIARGDEKRYDALDVMKKLTDAIEAQQVPQCDAVSWVSHELTQLPNIWDKDKNEREIYQITAVLTYIQGSR